MAAHLKIQANIDEHRSQIGHLARTFGQTMVESPELVLATQLLRVGFRGEPGSVPPLVLGRRHLA
jgi:hypothetical protein